MEQRPLSELSDDIKCRLKQTLDRRQSPNWRSLIKCLPSNTYARHHVEKFHMAVLKPGGSPTIEVLNDLSKKRKTIGDLIHWMISLASKYPDLQPLLYSIQSGGASQQPRIAFGPCSVEKTAGRQVVLLCEAAGQQPLQYQWFKGHQILCNATQRELHITKLEKSDEGYYICRVSNNFGYVFTEWARVVVLPPASPPQINLCVPRLLSQPSSRVQGAVGGMLTLYCDAVGDPAPKFQWMKDGTDLVGSTERWYIKQNITIDDQGCYNCRVYNGAGTIYSKDVCVFVEKCVSSAGTDFVVRGPMTGETCSDKVALLIGNQNYQFKDELGKLYHPMNDVCDLAGVLTSIGFKVVSLVNLTLEEMKRAVRLFYALLDEGMYALFYYAGHGFEIETHNYLMPVEATPHYLASESLDAWDVVQTMQAKNTKLNVILLDCCRTRPPNIDQGLLQPVAGVEQPNVVIAFGCCSKNSVFESPNRRNGFFAMHLLKHICEDRDIEQVLKEVSSGLRKEEVIDPVSHQQQLVTRVTSVSETMSLCARINPSPQSRTARWKAVHELPAAATVFEADGIKVQLLFEAEFSNVLIVNARVYADERSEARVNFEMPKSSGFPAVPCPVDTVTGTEPSRMQNTAGPSIRITGLQKLGNIPLLRLRVRYKHLGQEKDELVEHRMTEKPLYAKIVGYS